jgi:hypothetical protein
MCLNRPCVLRFRLEDKGRPSRAHPSRYRTAARGRRDYCRLDAGCRSCVLRGRLRDLAKAFPAGTPFEPVPWTLGIYGLFTAGGLVLAYRGRLSRGFVAISVVVDILVLMLTIWSFHLLVSGTARALLESADSDVRLHLDRIADTAVRARLRAARRRVRGFGLADAVPLCGVGIARGGVHAQLRRICHIVHNPTPRLGRT